MLLHSSADCCLQLGATRVCLQHGESVFLSPSLFREEVHILNAQLAPFTLIPLWRASSGPSLRSLHASFTSRAEGRQVDVVFPGRREWVNGLLFSAPVPARQQFTILGSLTAGEEGAWHFVDVVEVNNASLALFGLLADESFARLRVVSTLPQPAPFRLVAVNTLRPHFGSFVFFRKEAARIQLPTPSIYSYHFVQDAAQPAVCEGSVV